MYVKLGILLVVILVLMGLKMNREVYIVGEVDYRVIRLDGRWGCNLCLRYPSELIFKPDDLRSSMDYERELELGYYAIPPEERQKYCSGGGELRMEGKTRLVLLKGVYNTLFGYRDMQVVDSKEIYIVKNYAMK
jgi:hypothetical protein